MAGNQWFRMYHEFATDPKVQMLSEVDQRRFVMLLCLRCCNGDVTLQDEEVAFQLRINIDDWLSTKGVLLKVLLISKNNKPTAWDKRQFASDSSAARVSRHRNKKKRGCNVTETKCNALDTDTDTEKKKNIKKKFPNNFEISLSNRTFATENNLDVSGELDQFQNHHASNGKTFVDWQAAFRTWLGNAVKFAGGKTSETVVPMYEVLG